MSRVTLRAAVAALVSVCAGSNAQEAMRSPAATQPSEGTTTTTIRLSWDRYDNDPAGRGRTVLDRSLGLTLRHGLTKDWSINAFFTLTDREVDGGGGGGDLTGASDLRLEAKHRFWQDDKPGLNTTRAAVRFGAEIPTGTEDLSSHSIDPFVGVVVTSIQGRLGWNLSAEYLLSTSDDQTSVKAGQNEADLFTLSGGVAYRVWPEDFGGGAHGAGYVVLESELLLETNSDSTWSLAPGLLWEDRRWAGELSVILPVAQQASDRFERDWGLSLGFRWLF